MALRVRIVQQSHKTTIQRSDNWRSSAGLDGVCGCAQLWMETLVAALSACSAHAEQAGVVAGLLTSGAGEVWVLAGTRLPEAVGSGLAGPPGRREWSVRGSQGVRLAGSGQVGCSRGPRLPGAVGLRACRGRLPGAEISSGAHRGPGCRGWSVRGSQVPGCRKPSIWVLARTSAAGSSRFACSLGPGCQEWRSVQGLSEAQAVGSAQFGCSQQFRLPGEAGSGVRRGPGRRERSVRVLTAVSGYQGGPLGCSQRPWLPEAVRFGRSQQSRLPGEAGSGVRRR